MKNKLEILFGLFIIFIAFLATQSNIYTGKVIEDCYDSDDGDYFTKGTTTVADEELEDYCEGDILIEYYCKNKDLKVKVYDCPEECKDGACTVPSKKEIEKYKEYKSFKLGSVHDQIEIGESLGDVKSAITEYDTDALQGGRVTTKSSTTIYKQYIRFEADDLSSGRIVFAEDEYDEVGDFLFFDEDNFTFEYELQFENGFESEISGDDLEDLEGEYLKILDRTYLVSDASLDGNEVKISLVSGDLPSRLEEGSSKTFTINEKELKIDVLNIDDAERTVTLNFNNERTAKLSEGEITYFDNILIGIKNILISEAAEGADIVEFYLGAEKITFIDKDYTDDEFQQTIKVSGKSISSGYTKIKGTKSGDDFEILSIKYRMKPDAKKGRDAYVPPGKSLRESLRYSEAMLANWDIIYNGLSSKDDSSTIKLDPKDDQYNLKFQNIKESYYNIPFVINDGGSLRLGDDSETLHFIESPNNSHFIIEDGDYIVATSRNSDTGVTNIVRYSSVDTASKTVYFDDESEGGKHIPYTGTEGSGANGELILSGHSYRVYIGPAPSYDLAMDLTSDGDVSSDEANIVVLGGGIIDLGTNSTPINDFNITLTTLAKKFDSASSNEVINIEIQTSGSEVDLTIPTQSSVTIETETGKRLALSNYGVFLKQETDDPDELTIEYPKHQAVGDIEIVFFQTPKATIEIPKKEPEKEKPKPEPKEKPKEEPKPEPKLEPQIKHTERKPVKDFFLSIWRFLFGWI